METVRNVYETAQGQVHRPSGYQTNFYSKVVSSRSNLALESTAGSGKTTTLIEALKLLPYGRTILFVAFAKAIVEELTKKVPAHVTCRTMHSVGRSAIHAHFPGEVTLTDKKQISFIEPLLENEKMSIRLKWRSIYQLDHLLKLARATMAPATPEALQQVIENYALEELEERFLDFGARALSNLYRYNKDPDRYHLKIDFQDMIALPVMDHTVRMPQYDVVAIDEVQDLSNLDLEFVARLIKPGGRLLAVGDRNQAIYGFRGASPQSFDNLVKRFNCEVLPLNISYRCSKAVVANAQQIYPVIETYAGAKQGEVRRAAVSEVREGDLVLCRNNRPLIDLFFQLLLADKKAYIVGKEGVHSLLKLLSHCEPEDDSYAAMAKLNEEQRRLQESLKTKGLSRPDKHPKVLKLEEQINTLSIILSKFKTVGEVERWIEDTFTEDVDRPGVKLMTIHRAKGLEAHTVFVIDEYEGKQLIPSQYASTLDQLVQEKNLYFVSRTRSKNRLLLLELN